MTEAFTSAAKSWSSHSRRAKPTSAKLGGSSPRFARSYTAGMSFLRARSPVTPNRTSEQGPAIRFSRRSRGSRSGLLRRTSNVFGIAVLLILLAFSGEPCHGLNQLPGAGGAVGQMEPQDRASVVGQDLGVAGGLGGDQFAEAERA